MAGIGIGLASVAATTIGTDVPADLAGTALGISAVFVIAQTTAAAQYQPR